MDLTIPLVIVAVAVAFMLLGAVTDDRRIRTRRRAELRHDNVEAALPLLHSINDDRCIGCEACVDVCPTEVLDLVDHKVRVVRFTDCVQCEQCAHVCPTMALVMYREGTTPRMLTVPELDEHFQTGVPGQYLIGEVAGKPLVKNAANLGRAVIEHIAADLRAQPKIGGADVLDVVIVGSGPGGLSSGLTCLKRGLSCVVLEKEHVISSTVSRYPKGKHFMAEPSLDTNISFLPVFDASKEDLVAAWQKVVDGTKLPIKLGEAVDTVKRGDDGIFQIKTTVATYRARRVVLATGLRGKPRLLAVPGANLDKVLALLDDPAEFAGEHVLVVGGGDSAVEGAMSLADVGAQVTLSYRGDGFKRCKQGNQKRLAEMTAKQAMTVWLESNVTQFTPDAVSIKLKDGKVETIPNQHAFVLIGADTPVAWLEANNVRFIERPHLYTLGSTEEVVRRLVPDAIECARSAVDAIALVLGQRIQPLQHKPGRMKTMVSSLADEFREVMTEVSTVFQISDLQPPKPREQKRGAHGAVLRDTPVSGMNVIRRAAAGQVVPAARGAKPRQAVSNEFASERTSVTFGPERTVTAATAFGAESTIIGQPIRPRQRQAQAPVRKSTFGAPDASVRRRLNETASVPSFGDTGQFAAIGPQPAATRAAAKAPTPTPTTAPTPAPARAPTAARAKSPGAAKAAPTAAAPRSAAPSPTAVTNDTLPRPALGGNGDFADDMATTQAPRRPAPLPPRVAQAPRPAPVARVEQEFAEPDMDTDLEVDKVRVE